jgi:uncharacterized protein YjbI with pentapeptide repeats
MFTRISRRFVGISDDALMYILFTLFGAAVGISFTSHFYSQGVDLLSWFDSFFQNFGTEMFGAFLTFWLIEMLRGSRREREQAEREAQERKARLIRQMGSEVRDVAVPAVRELRAAGWLYDGSLEGVVLIKANLQGAYLLGANLQRVHLIEANLERAALLGANLEGAHLQKANLQEAYLSGANLQEADLEKANLQGTRLSDANLQKAHLKEANLQGAFLWGASLQEARLYETNLQETILQRAKLQEAYLIGANLREAYLEEANLQGAWLGVANLQGALLLEVNLQGARQVARDQLREASTLRGATLPDGTKLPNDDTWREAFEAWCETVETDESGYIKVDKDDD